LDFGLLKFRIFAPTPNFGVGVNLGFGAYLPAQAGYLEFTLNFVIEMANFRPLLFSNLSSINCL